LLVFTGSRYSIYVMLLWSPLENYKIVAWKNKELEDLEDLILYFIPNVSLPCIILYQKNKECYKYMVLIVKKNSPATMFSFWFLCLVALFFQLLVPCLSYNMYGIYFRSSANADWGQLICSLMHCTYISYVPCCLVLEGSMNWMKIELDEEMKTEKLSFWFVPDCHIFQLV
jgi:hypothetical protein